MSNYRNAAEFVQQTQFITPASEQRLRDGETLEFDLIATAKRELRNFVAFGAMLKSDLENLAEVAEGDQIDLEKLRESDIPSAMASNTLASDSSQLDSDVVNVTDEQWAKIQPGMEVSVAIRLNSDEEGNEYLNASVLEVHGFAKGQTENVGEEEFTQHQKPSAA